MFKEFVDSFDDSQKGLTKAWVKGGVVNPTKGFSLIAQLKFKKYMESFFFLFFFSAAHFSWQIIAVTLVEVHVPEMLNSVNLLDPGVMA